MTAQLDLTAKATKRKTTMHTHIEDLGALLPCDHIATAEIQRAIDACAATGGGVVRFPAGTYRSGTLHLRSGVTLRLEQGAVLEGSPDIGDYDRRYWGGGFLVGADLHEVGLEGPGVIDGVDCRDPAGEEGFRGPHCIALVRCRNVHVRDLTIRRSANWAFNCVECQDVAFERLTVLGGHDGVDAMHCLRFAFADCDFRTGDDCIAGADNADFRFERCAFNTSCNAFRFACFGLRVAHCRFWGPGEHVHKVSGRVNMLSAFVHFSPTDRRNCHGSEPHSDDWLVEHCAVEGVEQLYEYDCRTLWQTGRPVRRVVFRDVAASGLRRPVAVVGDTRRQFCLSLERVHLALPPGTPHHFPFFDLRSFDTLELRDVTCVGVDESHPALSTVDGLRTEVHSLTARPCGSKSFNVTS